MKTCFFSIVVLLSLLAVPNWATEQSYPLLTLREVRKTYSLEKKKTLIIRNPYGNVHVIPAISDTQNFLQVETSTYSPTLHDGLLAGTFSFVEETDRIVLTVKRDTHSVASHRDPTGVFVRLSRNLLGDLAIFAGGNVFVGTFTEDLTHNRVALIKADLQVGCEYLAAEGGLYVVGGKLSTHRLIDSSQVFGVMDSANCPLQLAGKELPSDLKKKLTERFGELN